MSSVAPRLSLPDAPVLVAGVRGAVLLSPDGTVESLSLAEAKRRAAAQRPILCHRTAVAARLGFEQLAGFDLLELFAFVCPARFCIPTPKGLAEATGQPEPKGLEAEAEALIEAARRLLLDLGEQVARETAARAAELRGIAFTMARGGWSWGPGVLAALGVHGGHRGAGRVWERLPEIAEHAPEPPAASHPVEPQEARERLARMLGPGAEQRPQQGDYASAACHAFGPREHVGEPRVVLAEAGTGTGKTLGYIAPASVWAEKNQGTVWISTFTRNLQRQLDSELDRLFPDPSEKARKVVVRKGRENYLCLLNLEEMAQRLALAPEDAAAVGLMSRWALATRDGDMVGGDLPGWLADLLGRHRVMGLADRRGECIFAAAPITTAASSSAPCGAPAAPRSSSPTMRW